MSFIDISLLFEKERKVKNYLKNYLILIGRKRYMLLFEICVFDC